MKSNIIELVNEAKLLNSKLFSLPRILILVALEELGEDGASYRELRAGLEMKDGTLFTNLNVLENMGYVKKTTVSLKEMEMHSYSITEEGRAALNSLRAWFKKLD